MTNNEEIVFDEKSGISVEEQRDILTAINSISEKNRKALASTDETAGKNRFKAKKTGGFFPILVNVAAVVFLAVGFLLLSSFHGKTEAGVKEGNLVFSAAERALIDEIRKETALRISAKENEIQQFISRMANVDSELQELYSSRQELTAEQRMAEARLLAQQEEYRAYLAVLQEERSKILEESHANETRLRAQLEARAREHAAAMERSSAELDSALNELAKLSREQDRAAIIEAQLGGGLAAAFDLIGRGELSQASMSLENLRNFINTRAFQTVRTIQNRKEFYLQTINSMEALLLEAKKYQQAGLGLSATDSETERVIADLRKKNEELEASVAGLNKSLNALSSGSSGQVQRLRELETESNVLRSEKAVLEAAISEKDRSIAAIQTERDTLNRTVTARNNTIRSIETILMEFPELDPRLTPPLVMEGLSELKKALRGN